MISAIHGGEQLIAMYPIDRKTKTLGERATFDLHGKDERLEGRMIAKQPTKH